MAQRFDVIVVGLGAMGAMACWQLARRGVKVLGLEQFGIPNTLGSSSGGSRMIRQLYHEHGDYIPLLLRSYELWEELEHESGQKLLHITGGIYMGEPDCDSIAGAISTAEQHHLAHDVLDRKQLAQRYPQFQVPDDYVGLFEPTAGWVAPEKSVAAACYVAMRSGAELHGFESVTKWEVNSNGVDVVTPRGTYQADQVIVCGGAWMSELLDELGTELWISRQVVGWVWPQKPEEFTDRSLPVWSLRRSDGTRLYGFPMGIEQPGLKVANHDRSVHGARDELCREPVAADEATFRSALAALLPAASGPLLSLQVCFYTNSLDLHALVGRHPTNNRVLVSGGCSGHGFKLAPVFGSILADLATRNKTDLPCEFLRADRFH